MRDSVPSTRYSSVCNVLRQWNIPLIPTYRVYRLYDTQRIMATQHRPGRGENWMAMQPQTSIATPQCDGEPAEEVSGGGGGPDLSAMA